MNTPLALPPVENRSSAAPSSVRLEGRRQRVTGQRLDFQIIWLNVLFLLLVVAAQESLPAESFAASFLGPIRLLLGLIYVLYAPGYCIIAALFPHQNELGGIERTGLSLGFSIAIVPILAVLLSRPWGLTQWSLLLGEAAVIALAMMIASWRQARMTSNHLPIAQAYDAQVSWHPKIWWRTLSRLEKSIYLLLSAMLSIALVSAIWLFLIPSPDQFMTEFYILGQNGQPQDYPPQARVGEELSVTIGIMNREQSPHRYRVEVWAVDPWQSNERVLLTEADLGLISPNITQQSLLDWSMPWEGDDQKVEFLLFIDNHPEAYRQLELWLNVSEE